MNSTTTKSKTLAVAGADIDPSLAMKLTAGDRVMVEVNGTRVYTQSNPICAESPWIVSSNTPPDRGVVPTQEHKLVLWHQGEHHELTLHYNHLLCLPRSQPAIFREYDAKLATDTEGNPQMAYIILQMVSHYILATDERKEYEGYYRADAALLMEDADIRSLIIEQWESLLSTFTKGGWNQKSTNRLALRAFVTPSDIDLLMLGAGEKLGVKKLLRIHEVLHWLPHQVASKMAEDRDVYEGDGHAPKASTDLQH